MGGDIRPSLYTRAPRVLTGFSSYAPTPGGTVCRDLTLVCFQLSQLTVAVTPTHTRWHALPRRLSQRSVVGCKHTWLGLCFLCGLNVYKAAVCALVRLLVLAAKPQAPPPHPTPQPPLQLIEKLGSLAGSVQTWLTGLNVQLTATQRSLLCFNELHQWDTDKDDELWL